MGWGPGPAKGSQKKQKRPHLWQSPQKTPTKSENFIFRFRLEDLLNP